MKEKYVCAKNVESKYGWSLAVIFGKSPKITFICGRCNKETSGRININEIHHGLLSYDRTSIKCKHCNTLNMFDVRIDRDF